MASIKESWIKKYGEEDALKKYEEYKIKNAKSKTLDGYIERYGQEEGLKKYKEKNSKLSVGRESLKKRGYSEEEIDEIKNKHSNKSHHGLQNYIYRFGLDEGLKKYQEYCESRKELSPRALEYWILKNNGDIKKSKEDLKNFQTRDLKFFISLYGNIEGAEKYKIYCSSKASWIKENFSKEEWGNMNKKRNSKRKNYSFNEIFLYEEICKNFPDLKIYGGQNVKNKYVFFIDDEFYAKKINKSAITPDIYIPNKKIVIEYYGDLYHANPLIYKEEQEVPILKLLSKQVWESDNYKNEFYS